VYGPPIGSGNQSGTPASGRLVSLEEIQDARQRLAGVIRPTVAVRADAIGKLLGRSLWLKPEQLQRAGSFKIRGAYNMISRLPAGAEVVAASAGNHAQGVALAATLTGTSATIFMPATAPLPKVEATKAYGATIRFVDGVVDDCIGAARSFAAEHGATWVPPFDDPLIVAGQGTIGLELLEEVPEVETVVVPVGGGGLISGIAAAMPGVRMIGVDVVDATRTMADGIAVKRLSDLTRAHIDALVDDIVTVTEEQISAAVVLLLERAKAVVEPAGAVGVAALVNGLVPGDGPVCAVLSGGNVDPLLLMKLIDHGLSAAGRYLVLRVRLPDRPGSLADLTAHIAAAGLNVLSVEHHRAGLDLDVNEVEVLVTLETRDPAHREEIVAALRADGYEVELVR
jgi:threonine dehydratase